VAGGRWFWYVKGECDAALGADFVFSIRSKELIIGDVYVRIYNEQPTFPLEVSHLFLHLCFASYWFWRTNWKTVLEKDLLEVIWWQATSQEGRILWDCVSNQPIGMISAGGVREI